MAGEQLPAGNQSHRRDGWVIQVGPIRTFEIDGLIQQIQAAIAVSPDEIKKVSSDLEIEAVLTCEVKSATSMPSMRFPDEFVQWAASMGAALDVDIMLLDPAEAVPYRGISGSY